MGSPCFIGILSVWQGTKRKVRILHPFVIPANAGIQHEQGFPRIRGGNTSDWMPDRIGHDVLTGFLKVRHDEITLSNRLSMSQSPGRHYAKRVACGELEYDRHQAAALETLDDILIRLTAPAKTSWLEAMGKRLRQTDAGPVKGAWLWGGVGTGKTLVMDIFAQCCPPEYVHRTHFHRYMQNVHAQRQSCKRQQEPLQLIAESQAQNFRVLCLDEFAVSDIADAMIMYGLLKNLFAAGIILVTTSNTPPGNLYKGGLQRDRFLPAIDLIERFTEQINVDLGNDYRMAYLSDAGIYHQPAGEAADIAMAKTFKKLSDTAVIKPAVLIINDREIPARAARGGVAWFAFSALCETNRSSADYIELARQFHTVLLSDLPLLDKDRDDAARRLIELIDELYDKNANLILSSDYLPHEIYCGYRLAEPFRRTASRLIEMTSMEYLQRAHTG